MDLTILLIETKNKTLSAHDWHLENKKTVHYYYNLAQPLINYGKVFSQSDMSHENIRRGARKIYDFIVNLNKGYKKADKITSIYVETKNKTQTKSESIIFDTLLEGLYLCNYVFNRHKTKNKKSIFKIHAKFHSNIYDYAVMGNYITRDLVNEPLSHLTAIKFSNFITKLGREAGFNVKVLNEKNIKSLKMGGVLSVNKGSIAKPTFNILTYKPKNAINKNPYVLVGKGVMYDTGGLSLKPTPNSMDMMKCDMAGAATVVGTIYALAKAKANKYVVGLIPAVENRPGGEAYVPGDVITMMNGLTVEVLNTDAEGRLILADALHYAKRYNPKLVIDIATLTGSAARSIGKHGIVAMEKNAYYATSNMYGLWEAGEITGERVAPQPFWDDYKNELTSSIADIKNLGGAEAGHITAGKFLEHFVAYPWIHLDIAGPAFVKSKFLYYNKGATGIGSRLLTHFIYNSHIKS